jgi:hypothetical protein
MPASNPNAPSPRRTPGERGITKSYAQRAAQPPQVARRLPARAPEPPAAQRRSRARFAVRAEFRLPPSGPIPRSAYSEPLREPGWVGWRSNSSAVPRNKNTADGDAASNPTRRPRAATPSAASRNLTHNALPKPTGRKTPPSAGSGATCRSTPSTLLPRRLLCPPQVATPAIGTDSAPRIRAPPLAALRQGAMDHHWSLRGRSARARASGVSSRKFTRTPKALPSAWRRL